MPLEQAKQIAPEYDEDAINAALEIAESMSVMPLRVVRASFGDDRFGHVVAHRYDESRYVLQDASTGLYLKAHPSLDDARTQQAVMNALHRRLSQSDIGITAVRHLAVVNQPRGRAVSVIEPAPGVSLRARYRGSLSMTLEAEMVHIRLRRELGDFVAYTLINDVQRGGNIGGNVMINDEDGTHVLIDQPSLRTRLPHAMVGAALQLITQQSQRRS